MKRVLVLGGSGALGSALLREFKRSGADVVFTYCGNAQAAAAIGEELGFPAYAADFAQADAIEALFDALARDARLPDVVVHCAGVAPLALVGAVTAAAWDAVHAVHGRAALLCAQQMEQRGLRGALVLVAALDGLQPVPAPAHYAASQAALWGLTMALAKELGPKGILVNLAVVGVLDGGIAAALDPKLRESYRRYSALGRTGTCIEAARGLRWLALENTYLNGAQFPLTGGLG
ncbi:SDR family oxidoreductase [Massilia sp. DJPM01]|uniref:SDR family NAD(P)-dependent oxidoreductase n=1 Tax=Massilia sp. DJPM01 TaxID=3024404 RepID=UPI00259F6009|nr:SDR family oxidoreductase [Massilia sp. DJPM01]MDM5180229.1 SDR family oxidoreductase [Massilia sp. DJPM01]